MMIGNRLESVSDILRCYNVTLSMLVSNQMSMKRQAGLT